MEIDEIELARRLADARLEVAEELGWTCAGLVVWAAYATWHSILLSAALGAGAYFVAIRRYSRAHQKAWGGL